ncbi:MAG: transcription elongation protein SprT [Bergeyella sp.]|nr:transcription elongation protein SprT [Bergeyella sp.]
MSISSLEKYLPAPSFSYLKLWFGEYRIHIHVSRERQTKLGDYRKNPDGSHAISINGNLSPYLFFFVFTHELAHLLAFEKHGRSIAPHGKEWKALFSQMIGESMEVYPEDLRSILHQFSLAPKANFMSASTLVSYFYPKKKKGDEFFIEELMINDTFVYKEQSYRYLRRLRKNYLCRSLRTGRSYIFSPSVKVKRLMQ